MECERGLEHMDIVMRKGTEKKVFWDFEDGEFRDITNGLGTVYSAEEFNKLYNKSLNRNIRGLL